MSSPRVFGLPHLSEDAVAAFADGVLSAAAASRAQRHCAECAECADAVRGQREAAMMLRAAQAPALPSGLLDRLNGLPMSAPLPPRRGGLPTVLDADGIAMFVAHDVHKAGKAAEAEQPHGRALSQPATPNQTQARPAHRRATLPITVLASAAAVVAAGTLGGHVSTLAAAADRQAQSGAANAAGSVTGGQTPGARSVTPLAGAGSLLSISRRSAGAAGAAGMAPGQASMPALLASGGQSSLTLAPLRQPVRPAGTATTAVHRSSLSGPAAQHVEWSSTGFAPPMAGAPTATP